MTFQEYLIKWYGQRIRVLTEYKSEDLVLNHEKIVDDLEPNFDKCKSCIASKFRQDIPFWVGSHRNKKLMVIAQDAGKGEEDYGLNTVFSIHWAQIDKEKYFDASPRHEGYYNLFKGFMGAEHFLNDIYFTDIVKCAYSTDPSISLSIPICKDDLFYEISEVNPLSVIFMGIAAQRTFLKLLNDQDENLSLIFSESCFINQRTSISFKHYLFYQRNIFFIPHLIGNLHISKEHRDGFDKFVLAISSYISSKNK